MREFSNFGTFYYVLVWHVHCTKKSYCTFKTSDKKNCLLPQDSEKKLSRSPFSSFAAKKFPRPSRGLAEKIFFYYIAWLDRVPSLHSRPVYAHCRWRQFFLSHFCAVILLQSDSASVSSGARGIRHNFFCCSTFPRCFAFRVDWGDGKKKKTRPRA